MASFTLKSGTGLSYYIATSGSYSLLNGKKSAVKLYSTNYADNIIGSSGNDTVLGGGGNDTISGGDGHDTLYGETGNDSLNGGNGNDYLDGGVGSDILNGGAGNDIYIIDSSSDTVVENINSGIDEIRTSLTNLDLGYPGFVNVENLKYIGTGNFTAVGNSLNNVITGSSGSDVLDGGIGNDTLAGGAGNDTYLVDTLEDRIMENAASGTDAVKTILSSYTLARTDLNNVENLTFTGTGNFSGTGNALSNAITGGYGDDILDGGAGNDVLHGGIGNDTYVVDATGDTVSEVAGQGIDSVHSKANVFSIAASGEVEDLTFIGTGNFTGTGNAQNNTITGNSGDDVLDGGAGTDILNGGVGNDTYVVDNVSDVINEAEGQGVDTARTSLNAFSLAGLSAIENLSFSGAGDFTGTGNALNNVINGGSGNDVLDGAGGKDVLSGHSGNDTYIVDSTDVSINEGLSQGTDSVRTTLATYSLAAVANVENLAYTGVGSFSGTGNASNNIILGGDSEDTLDGGLGNDVLRGGLGNDTYVVDTSSDLVEEAADQGLDTIQSRLNFFSLAAFGNVENLSFTGTDNFTGTGNALDNVIIGGARNDILDGAGGNDILDGGQGDDIYVINNLGAVIRESAGQGNDTVQTSLNFLSLDLGLNVEVVEFTGSGAFHLKAIPQNITTTNIDSTATFHTSAIIVKGTGKSDDNLTTTGISSIMFGLGGNDSITGSSYDDTLYGGGGRDMLIGGDGDDELYGQGNNTNYESDGDIESSDLLIGGLGNDKIDGGGGRDIAKYLGDFEDYLIEKTDNGYNVTDTNNDTMSGGDEGTDYLENIEYIEFADYLLDLKNPTPLNGFVFLLNPQGAFVKSFTEITGSSGAIQYIIDSIPNPERYTILVGAGTYIDNIIDLPNGVNIDLSLADSNDSNLANGFEVDASGNQTKSNIIGSAYADDIKGSNGDDTINGNDGADTILGSDGDDKIDGGQGADVIDGENDNDTITYYEGADSIDGGNNIDTLKIINGSFSSSSTATYFFNLNDPDQSSDASDALVENFENIDASSVTNNNIKFNITGSSVANIINGGAGDDTIDGGDGDDTIDGGAGADVIDGENDNDTITYYENAFSINGGDDIDTLKIIDDSFSSSSISPFVFDLSSATDQSSDPSDAEVTNFENIDASNVTDSDMSFDITGSSDANIIKGGSGDDTIDGGDGDDTIDGGGGADSLTGGIGSDVFICNANPLLGSSDSNSTTFDTIYDLTYDTVTPSNTDVVRLVLTDVSNFEILSDISVISGTTNDSYGADTNGDGDFTDPGDVIFEIPSSTLTSPQAQEITQLIATGTSGADTISGYNLSDTINGGGGADSLTGGLGEDTFAYMAATDGGDILDFIGGTDNLSFDTSGFSVSTPLAFQTEATFSAITADGNFLIATSTISYANINAAAQDISNNTNITNTNGYFIYANSTDSHSYLVYSDNLDGDGTEVVLADLGLTTNTNLGNIVAGDILFV